MFMLTERLLLRHFVISDTEECFKNFGQDASIGRYIAGYPIHTFNEMEKMITAFMDNENIWLIENKLTHSPMGYITVDLSYEMLGIGELGFLMGESF